MERHYFTFDLDTGLITQTDYWYRDLVTRKLTDRLGITEQVFGDSEDFRTIYVSPDRTKILYSTRKPQVPHCDHDCETETLWITDRSGSNPIALTDFYEGTIEQVTWGKDDKIYLSLSSPVMAGTDLILTVCADGSCEMYDDELILKGRSLPFKYVEHLPVWSPNGQWIAVTMGSEQLAADGIFSTGVVVENEGDRYIQLPFNGRVAAPIVWLDDDTILYPVMGIGWDGKDYGLPSDFYEQDALWEIHLDFNALTYRIGDRLTEWVRSRKWYDQMWEYAGIESYHIIAAGDKAIVYSHHGLDIYCFSRG